MGTGDAACQGREKPTPSTGCSKRSRCKAAKVGTTEAYAGVRRREAQPSQRRRWAFFNSLSGSAGEAVVHPMHVGRVEARHVVRRSERLAVEELGQLVVLLGEAGLAIELPLQLQCLAAQRFVELRSQA